MKLRRASQNKSPLIPSDARGLAPMKFQRTVVAAYDITTNGIAANTGLINFSLSDLPTSGDFTNLFDLYKIDRIEIEWTPEYTELTDASALSNAVNVYFNTAIDPAGNTPASVDDVLQYRTLHSTSITQMHKRSFVPTYLLDNIIPASCYISTSSPNSNLFGIVYGIPATGVAMTFRSKAKFHLSLALAK